MKQYTVAEKRQTGMNATSVLLRPVDPDDAYYYEAGQYVAVGFKRGWQRTPMRCFSATTAPSETGEIGIAFRTQGKFTSRFAELQPGSIVDIEGPFGDFVVPRDESGPLLFMAGGIGITPFVSMLRDLAARRTNKRQATLLYSVRSLEDIPFARELMELDRDNPEITVRFLTENVPADKLSHPLIIKSKLNEDIVEQFATRDTHYYICGPAGYTAHCHRVLGAFDIDESAIHNEAFSQASKLTVAGFALQNVVYGLLGIAVVFGAGLFMAKDVIKKHELSEAATASQAATYQTQTSTTPSYTSAQSTSTTGSSSTNNSTYSTPTYQTYQAPRSSMS